MRRLIPAALLLLAACEGMVPPVTTTPVVPVVPAPIDLTAPPVVEGREGGIDPVTGLDHVGFAVPTRADLEAWQQHLEANGVVRKDAAATALTQSPIADEPYGSVLVFRDPDNVQLELFCPPAA